jgi:hypothetical protein
MLYYLLLFYSFFCWFFVCVKRLKNVDFWGRRMYSQSDFSCFLWFFCDIFDKFLWKLMNFYECFRKFIESVQPFLKKTWKLWNLWKSLEICQNLVKNRVKIERFLGSFLRVFEGFRGRQNRQKWPKIGFWGWTGLEPKRVFWYIKSDPFGRLGVAILGRFVNRFT